MKRITIDELQPGMRLARTIYYHYGGVMLSAGTQIEGSQIPRLRDFGLRSVYIHDHDLSQVVVYDFVDEKTRNEITKRVSQLYSNLRDETRRVVDPGDLFTGSLEEVRRKLNHRNIRKVLDRAKIHETFLGDVEKIIEGILSDEELCLCVGTIKTAQSFIYDHSIEVSLHSAIIAKKLGFTRSEMKEMLLGSLLHDIGYIFLPEDVLQKTEPLTPKEEDIIKQHPIFGYYLLKSHPDVGLLSAHVAYQHHERQDGGGYPRRLKGNNRILRPNESMADTAGMIHRYADVVAVPNYYDNLVSPRPNRPALAPDEAVRMVREAAGSMLNREVVDVFLSYLPVFPLGTQVTVLKGDYAGYKGVVARAYSGDLDRPTIILLESGDERLKEPLVIDLREHDDVPIRALWS